MTKMPFLARLAPLVLVGVVGCAHGPLAKPVRLSPAALSLVNEAKAITSISSEEDYLLAKLVYQALPDNAPEHPRLRGKLLEYLLGPLSTLDAQQVRENPDLLGNEDGFDRLAESFRDALEVFPPTLLWASGGLHLDKRERALVLAAAKLLVSIHSPRGNELPVATALYVLMTIEPTNGEWRARIEQLLAWLDAGTKLAGTHGPRNLRSPTDVLEHVAAVWPTPTVLERLAKLTLAQQDKVASILRRPLGSGEATRGLLSELLIDSGSLSNMAVSSAAFYLRCGQLTRAAEIAARFADKPGDDPGFRRLLQAGAAPGAKAADLLALARRLLPRSDLLRGTSTDRIDPVAAMGILRRGLTEYPQGSDLLILASRVARLLSAPVLSLRLLDEAIAVLAAKQAGPDTLGVLAAERMELAFLRLKIHVDPDRIVVAEREADGLRRQFAEARHRFGASHFKLDDADIDVLLAGGLVDAGQIEKAAPLLLRARRPGDADVDVARQLANLAIKRGDPQQAIVLLRQALNARERNAPPEDTLPYVEGQARLSFALGNAYEVMANLTDARKAWAAAARSWERLMLEHIRRRNPSSAAEATFEVARLYYLLGRREEGLRKFDEAIAQDEDRDQSYLDAIAFLVQRGEGAPALDIFRRALSRSSRSVSEYVKVYASLWILDLTRRSGGVPDAGASAYLRGIAERKVTLRPTRTAAWYTELARYAVGQLDYTALLAKADTTGKRAEAYFYEAMRRLSSGKSDEAHALWSKVMETKMLSFFEFEMAARYLRTGAPARPETSDVNETI